MLQVQRVQQVHKEFKVQQEPQEPRVLRVHKEFKVQREPRVQQVHKEFKVSQEPQEPQVLKVNQDNHQTITIIKSIHQPRLHLLEMVK